MAKLSKHKGRWFRFYAGAMHDPKVLALSDAHFRFWTDLMCIACADESNGELPSAKAVALTLRLKESEVSKRFEALVEAGLLDKSPSLFRLHNWDERQFQTDNSGAVRTAKHRAKSRSEETLHGRHMERPLYDSVSGSESEYDTTDSDLGSDRNLVGSTLRANDPFERLN